MDQIIVAGIETALAANLGVRIAARATVLGIVNAGPALALPGCNVEVCNDGSTTACVGSCNDGVRRSF